MQVRAAMPGMPVSEQNCHPFQWGRYMWMHNGLVGGFMQIRRALLGTLSDAAYDTVQSFHSDSAVCFSVFLHHLPDLTSLHPPQVVLRALEVRYLMQGCSHSFWGTGKGGPVGEEERRGKRVRGRGREIEAVGWREKEEGRGERKRCQFFLSFQYMACTGNRPCGCWSLERWSSAYIEILKSGWVPGSKDVLHRKMPCRQASQAPEKLRRPKPLQLCT